METPALIIDPSSQQEFSDADFAIVDNGDQSKKFKWQVSGVSTGTTRTATVPDADITLVAITSGTATPTPTAGSGTFTSASASTQWTRVGDRVFLTGNFINTTNGTAATYVAIPLPFTANASNFGGGSGWRNTTGALITALIVNGGTEVRLFNADGTYPGASGQALRFQVQYTV